MSDDLPPYIDDSDAIVTASVDGRDELVRDLLSNGISPDTTDEYGSTGLHAAAKEGNPLIAQLFIQARADINKKGNDGNTPLDLAVFYGHSHIVELLLQYGAKKTAGLSPIQIQEDEIHKAFETKNAVERLLSLTHSHKNLDQDPESNMPHN